jgi:hypothetical protein
VITHLVDAALPLDHVPLLRDAVACWRGGIATRKPKCIGGCKRSFADGTTKPGAFLFATAEAAPKSAGLSALCTCCWEALFDDEVEAVALKVLRRVMPNARFEDA